jgi:small conductance mechanosensitive channel
MLQGLTWQEVQLSAIVVAAVLSLVFAALWASKRAIRRMADRMEEKDKEHIQEIERWAQDLTRFVRRAIWIAAGVASLFIILRGLGIEGIPRLSWDLIAAWLLGPGIRILLVLGGAYAISRAGRFLIARLPTLLAKRGGTAVEKAEEEKRLATILGGAYAISRAGRFLIARLPTLLAKRGGTAVEKGEEEKRLATITGLLSMLLTTVVMAIAILIVLREIGLDITPILTGAGIMGLAVGFGAQNLVRDVITGFFMILENQVRVGDVAVINGKGGVVQEMRLRTVVLRSLDGTVHVIPNGTINELSNMTKDFSYAVLDLGVAYKEDTDNVVEVVKEVAAELRRDPDYASKILEDLQVLGVDAFADSAVVIKVRIKTVPIQQWTVARELRRRLKKAFDAKGIEIPFPHMSLYFGEASKPFAVQVAEELAKQQSAGTSPNRESS